MLPPTCKCSSNKILEDTSNTRRKLSITTIHSDLPVARKCVNKSFGCQPHVFSCTFWTIANQNPPNDNQYDLFMHFLDMNRNGQVASGSCNGQEFF